MTDTVNTAERPLVPAAPPAGTKLTSSRSPVTLRTLAGYPTREGFRRFIRESFPGTIKTEMGFKSAFYDLEIGHPVSPATAGLYAEGLNAGGVRTLAGTRLTPDDLDIVVAPRQGRSPTVGSRRWREGKYANRPTG